MLNVTTLRAPKQRQGLVEQVAKRHAGRLATRQDRTLQVG
jgi:hypothetical protein